MEQEKYKIKQNGNLYVVYKDRYICGQRQDDVNAMFESEESAILQMEILNKEIDSNFKVYAEAIVKNLHSAFTNERETTIRLKKHIGFLIGAVVLLSLSTIILSILN